MIRVFRVQISFSWASTLFLGVAGSSVADLRLSLGSRKFSFRTQEASFNYGTMITLAEMLYVETIHTLKDMYWIKWVDWLGCYPATVGEKYQEVLIFHSENLASKAHGVLPQIVPKACSVWLQSLGGFQKVKPGVIIALFSASVDLFIVQMDLFASCK